jgi:hypothetical protein
MIGVDDAGAVQSWLDDTSRCCYRQAGIPGLPSRTLKTEEYQGVKITYGAVPTTGAWGVVNGALVVGLTPNAVEQAVDLAAGTAPRSAPTPTSRRRSTAFRGPDALFVDVNAS